MEGTRIVFRCFAVSIGILFAPWWSFTAECAGVFQDDVALQSVENLRSKLASFGNQALSISVDGSVDDWDGFPVFDSGTNDGCIEAKNIRSVWIAPLPERLIGAVRLEDVSFENTELIVDIDLWGQMQVDFRLTIPLDKPAKATISLNTTESWYSDESPRTNSFETNALSASVSERGIVEFSLAYSEFRKLINEQAELKGVFNKRIGTLPNSPKSRSWVRISPSLNKKDNGIVDRGVACACWTLSEKTVLPETNPRDGVMYLDVPFDDQWYIGQGGFGVGSHAQLNAYDLYETDRWLHPSRTWRTPKNEEYLSWQKPIYAPATGRVKFQRSDNVDIPSFAPSKERITADNRLTIEAEENGGLITLLHFSKGTVAVGTSDRVSPRKTVAKTGNSGQTGWPHLHIECRVPPTNKKYEVASPVGFRHVCVSLNNCIEDPWRLDLPCWEIKEGFFVSISDATLRSAMHTRRVWEDRTGRFKVAAKLVELSEEFVKLQKEDGSIISVPISKLSYEDQTLAYYKLRRKSAAN